MMQSAFSLLLLLASCAVQAQPIYRCGPGGAEYSQKPCPGGTVVESSDPRTAAQRAEAVRVAARDRRRAAELEREQRAQQAAFQPSTATGFNGRPARAESTPMPASKRKKSKPAASDKEADFVALEPASGPKRKRN